MFDPNLLSDFGNIEKLCVICVSQKFIFVMQPLQNYWSIIIIGHELHVVHS